MTVRRPGVHRDGNHHAVAVTEHLDLEVTAGMVRIGVVHYDTPAEVERPLVAVERLASESRASP